MTPKERATTSSYILGRAERLFRRLDLDSDGSITLAELLEVMQRSGGLSRASAELTASNLIGKVDFDRNQAIELHEFIHFFQIEEVMKRIFKINSSSNFFLKY